MPVFISYSHTDKIFVENLAMQLVSHKASIWLDKWELNVGDLIVDKVQNAIQGASALVVVLSKASVESEWCKKELSGGLLKELEEKRVVVMPVLLEDCDMPLFVRSKVYADFRTNFDEGLKTLLEGIAKVTSDSLGRIDEPEYHCDWAIDWGVFVEDCFTMRLTLVEQAEGMPFSCLTIVSIFADAIGTKEYYENCEKHSDEYARLKILSLLATQIEEGLDIRPKLSDQFAQTKDYPITDKESGALYVTSVTARRLGEDTGRDILLNVGSQLLWITKTLQGVIKSPGNH